ncbi:MAG: chemotaxis protein CheW [Lachnospira sp.]|nr:chemotaxis protein CheW [Lachnospira sp.]
MANYIKPVVFKLGNELYGVDINMVRGIENQLNIVPVPNAISYVKGIINLRGEVVPIYSLKRKFNMPDTTPLRSCIIINLEQTLLALEVDEVVEIGQLDDKNITPMPTIVKKEDTMYLDRVANVDGKLIILLDVNKLLTEDEVESVIKLAEDLQ